MVHGWYNREDDPVIYVKRQGKSISKADLQKEQDEVYLNIKDTCVWVTNGNKGND